LQKSKEEKLRKKGGKEKKKAKKKGMKKESLKKKMGGIFLVLYSDMVMESLLQGPKTDAQCFTPKKSISKALEALKWMCGQTDGQLQTEAIF